MAITNDEFFIDDIEETEFTYEEHHVIWANAEDTTYPVWYCETHNKHFYGECV